MVKQLWACMHGAGAAEAARALMPPPNRYRIESGGGVESLAVVLDGVIFPFMFGWVAPVRPSMIWSLQHPTYEVRTALVHIPGLHRGPPSLMESLFNY